MDYDDMHCWIGFDSLIGDCAYPSWRSRILILDVFDVIPIDRGLSRGSFLIGNNPHRMIIWRLVDLGLILYLYIFSSS